MSTANKAARRGSGRSGSSTVASPPQVATRTVRRLASGPTGYRNGQVKTQGKFAHGKLDGPWIWYRAGGRLAANRRVRPGPAGRPMDAAPCPRRSAR